MAIYACPVVLDTKYYVEQVSLLVCFVHLRITSSVRKGNHSSPQKVTLKNLAVLPHNTKDRDS